MATGRVSTAFTRVAGVTAPIFGAPMAGASGGKLAAAEARGGALASIAMPMLRQASPQPGDEDPCGSIAALENECAIFREEAPMNPMCIGFIEDLCVQKRGDHSLIMDAIAKVKPDFVQLFNPCTTELVRSIKSLPGPQPPLVIAQVGCLKDARRVVFEAGVDGVIAQGKEAGGHGLRPHLSSGTLPLARRVAELVANSGRDCFVLAAGGIVDAEGVAAALALGCDGAVLGTRLWATHQAMGSEEKKKALRGAECDDAVRTGAYDALNNAVQRSQANGLEWRWPYDTCGVLLDEKEMSMGLDLEGWANEQSVEAASAYLAKAFPLAGEGVGSIREVECAEVVVRRIAEGVPGVIRRSHALLVE